MTRLNSAVLALFLLGGCHAKSKSTDTMSSEPTGEVVVSRDLAYPPPSGVESDLATLDVFRIDDGQIRPLVLLVHGGSWVGGDKSNFESKIVPWWLDQGYVAASVNFRLATRPGQTPVVKPTDQTADIAAALSWLIATASEHGIEPQNVVVMGYSSGAHLAALLGTDEGYVNRAGLDENIIGGVISLDVHVYDVPFALTLMDGSVVEQNIPSILHLFGATESEQLAASPIAFTDGWAADALVVSVDQDPNTEGTHGYIVSTASSRYVDALNAAGHQASWIHDRSETHFSLVDGFGKPDDATTQAVVTFLDNVP